MDRYAGSDNNHSLGDIPFVANKEMDKEKKRKKTSKEHNCNEIPIRSNKTNTNDDITNNEEFQRFIWGGKHSTATAGSTGPK